jgi:electron transfer flavoprotein alpha subunit
MVASLYNIAEERKAIWIFLEQEGDNLEGVSLELLAKGRAVANEIGWRLVGLLIGKDVNELAKTAVAHGADEVLLVDHPSLEVFTIDAYAHITFRALMEHKPSVFLLGATPNGRDLAGRLAVRLRTGLNADCTDLRISPESGVLVSEVSGFGGGVLALIEMQNHRPQMATVRPGVFPPGEPDPERKGEMLVAGGRGIDGDFDMMRELARLLGGDIGATRPPVDEGHIERERQIGQTGVVCRPKVAICCGISGAFHFVVGIQDADMVIAINSDPEAPIFDFADYCVVGDVHRVVPALITALQQVEEVTHA